MEAAAIPTWTVHTEVFEGPLDLLLYLVQRDGIDLKRLQVSRIADAYLEYLDHMRELNLSVAGEYLVMAATLVHLKSLDLLPRLPTPIEEDAPDPREAFAEKLRSYQRYREAADAFDQRRWLGRDQFARSEPDEVEGAIEPGLDAFGLLDLYRQLLAVSQAPEPEVTFAHEPRLDLGDAAMALLDTLRRDGGRGELTSLLSALPTRALRVVTFISVLEMLRLGWIALEQRHHLAPIELSVSAPASVTDVRALSGWIEEGEAG